jgi:hypothetical protein
MGGIKWILSEVFLLHTLLLSSPLLGPEKNFGTTKEPLNSRYGR